MAKTTNRKERFVNVAFHDGNLSLSLRDGKISSQRISTLSSKFSASDDHSVSISYRRERKLNRIRCNHFFLYRIDFRSPLTGSDVCKSIRPRFRKKKFQFLNVSSVLRDNRARNWKNPRPQIRGKHCDADRGRRSRYRTS